MIIHNTNPNPRGWRAEPAPRHDRHLQFSKYIKEVRSLPGQANFEPADIRVGNHLCSPYVLLCCVLSIVLSSVNVRMFCFVILEVAPLLSFMTFSMDVT